MFRVTFDDQYCRVAGREGEAKRDGERGGPKVPGSPEPAAFSSRPRAVFPKIGRRNALAPAIRKTLAAVVLVRWPVARPDAVTVRPAAIAEMAKSTLAVMRVPGRVFVSTR